MAPSISPMDILTVINTATELVARSTTYFSRLPHSIESVEEFISAIGVSSSLYLALNSNKHRFGGLDFSTCQSLNLRYETLHAISQLHAGYERFAGQDDHTGDINQGQFRRHRRGRRSRGTEKIMGNWESESKTPFEREFLFRSPNTKPSMPGIVHLDSQCSIPFIVSRRWVKEAGRESDMSTDFKAPDSYSISGHLMKFCGIMRNMSFTPKGSTHTFRRDFLVSDELDAFGDFIIGAKFMIEQWSLLFGKMKKWVAPWFAKKKETPAESQQGQILKDDQEQKAHEAELRRREKKAQEARANEARRREQEGNVEDGNQQ